MLMRLLLDRYGKFAGVFFSTGSQGSGQESTALTVLPFFAHHGINFVPIGYKCGKLGDNSAVHGGKFILAQLALFVFSLFLIE